jgi:hypothetical protein
MTQLVIESAAQPDLCDLDETPVNGRSVPCRVSEL